MESVCRCQLPRQYCDSPNSAPRAGVAGLNRTKFDAGDFHLCQKLNLLVTAKLSDGARRLRRFSARSGWARKMAVITGRSRVEAA
jgi:hypothetical protein